MIENNMVNIGLTYRIKNLQEIYTLAIPLSGINNIGKQVHDSKFSYPDNFTVCNRPVFGKVLR
jgi:hypothetical protein